MSEQDYYEMGQKDGAKGTWRNIYSDFTEMTTTAEGVKEKMQKNKDAYEAGFKNGKNQR